MKLIVTGHARHGKDTVCDILKNNYGLQFQSSSYFVAQRAVRPYLEGKGIVYPSLQACYDDRVNHRSDWFDAIQNYNTPDRAKLGRELFQTYDVYCGLRCIKELFALRNAGMVSCVIWVDAAKRVNPEPWTSITVTPLDCNIVLENNGDIEELHYNIGAMMEEIENYSQEGVH
jgi:dephospho-CoA kinase